MKKKLGLLFAIIVMTLMFAVSANALNETGKCGENVYWNYDSTTKELVISGTGAMYNYANFYNSSRKSPFYDSDIETVIIEDGVTTIAEDVFSGCDNLTSVTIPDSVITIGKNAFFSCNGLTSITLPDSVITIGVGAFESCTKLTSITIPGSVTKISERVFRKCSSLSNIIIPEGVTSIGSDAFIYCSNLANITISDSVTLIDPSAFYGTAYYNDVANWENDVLYIGKHLIKANTIISGDYTIKNGTFTIAYGAFMGCDDLISITIPNSVTTLGGEAFSNCYSLTSITIGGGVTTIGSSAFYNCKSLTNIIVDENNTAYSSDDCGVLFDKNKTLLIKYPMGNSNISYTIPDSVITICGGAFSSCNNLTSITIPEGVITIGAFAFDFCDNLISITIPDSVTTIGDNAFCACTNLTNVTIGDSVTTIGGYAFCECSNLTNITIGDGVITIGDCAFMGCVSLTSITIPKSITTIGDYAFDNFSNLTDIYYKGTEEQWNQITIGSFDEYLSGVAIHYAVESGSCGINVTYVLYDDGTLTIQGTGAIGASFFYRNSEIKRVIIEDGITEIGDSAFYDCESFTSIIIPESVTSIGDFAFKDSGLTDIIIPDTVTTIGLHAFKYTDYYMDSTNWEDGGLYIGKHLVEVYEFYSSDDDVFYVKNGTLTIAGGVFDSCTMISGVVIPESVTTMSGNSFIWSSLKNIKIDPNNQNFVNDSYGCVYTKDMKRFVAVPIKMTLDLYTIPDSVIEIGECAFHSCSGIKNIIIPEGVTTIASAAFLGTEIRNITIPNSVTRVGEYAFNDCQGLESITIGNGVTSIEDGAFYLCYNLTDVYYNGSEDQWKKVTIGSDNEYLTDATIHYAVETGKCGDNVTYAIYDDDKVVISGTGTMYDYSYYEYNNSPFCNRDIKTVVIKDGVTSIGSYVFYKCYSLIDVKISNSVISIGYDAFYNCTSLVSIIIPDSVVSIGPEAFENCKSLSSISIPDSVISIGHEAFEYCSSLVSVNIPDSVTSIGGYAFGYCESLTSVKIPDSVTSLGNYTFQECVNLVDITIPNSVTSIGRGAFYYCRSLKNITIPKGVTTISGNMFYDCNSLKSVTLPDSVTSIEDYAFYSCNNLTDVYYGGNCEQWGKISLGLHNEDLSYTTLHFSSHSHNAVVTDPTCTGQGYTTYICECGDTYVADYVEPTHTWGDWITNEYNQKIRTCFVCGEEELVGEIQVGKIKNFTAKAVCDSVYLDWDDVTGDAIVYSVFCKFPESNSYVLIHEGLDSDAECGFDVYGIYWYKVMAFASIDGEFYDGEFSEEISIEVKAHSYTSQIITPATHLTQGCEKFTCYCGHNYTEIIPNLEGHTYDSAITKEATHLEEGTLTYTCECGDTYDESIAKLEDHTYVPVVTKEATHLEEGTLTYTCECGDTYDEPIAKLEDHTYVPAVTKEATHLEEGTLTYTCECGDTYDEPIAKLKDHTYVPTTTKEATHLEEGTFTYTCECGNTYDEPIAKLEGHTYVPVVTKEATHLAEGTLTHICACGDLYDESIEKITEHSYKETIVAPTCSSKGFSEFKCECGDYYITNYIGVKPHTYGYSIVKPATHLVEGKGVYTCSICGDHYDEAIAKTKEHTYIDKKVNATCNSQGYIEHICDCGDSYKTDYTAKTDHKDTNSDGVCDGCGYNLIENCNCNCHGNLIQKIIFKITNFLASLFDKSKKVCACGVSH